MDEIKFTFDVEKLINKLQQENFSIFTKPKFAIYNSFALITQQEILKDKTDICQPTALYNAFPELYDCKLANVQKVINNCQYSIPSKLIDYLNDDLNKLNIGYKVDKLIPTFDNFKKQIDYKDPVTISYKTKNSITGHTMAFLGYDKKNIYYFDNLPNAFITNLINYIRLYYNINTNKLQKLLGYSYDSKTKLSKIKIDAIIDKDIFIDATIMFYRIKSAVSLSDLTDRLSILNTKML